MSDLNGGNRINPIYSFASLAEVIKRPLETVKRWFQWDVEEVDLALLTDAIVPVKGYKAIVRSGGAKGDEVLHIAPSSYQIITNSQFEDIIADYEKIGCTYIEHGEFNNGRQLWCQLESNELAPWLVGGVDQGSRARGDGFVIKHTKSAQNRIDDARAQIRAIGELSRRAVESFQLLNATPIAVHENEQFFADLFGFKKAIRFSRVNGVKVPSPEPVYSGRAINTLSKLEDAYSHELQRELGNTAWRLLNAVTYYVDHSPHIRESRREKGYHMTGTGAMTKYRAYKLLMAKAQSNGHAHSWQPSGIIQ